ncbi:hypothetical protein V8E53_004493 [Lactarius tabidus]
MHLVCGSALERTAPDLYGDVVQTTLLHLKLPDCSSSARPRAQKSGSRGGERSKGTRSDSKDGEATTPALQFCMITHFDRPKLEVLLSPCDEPLQVRVSPPTRPQREEVPTTIRNHLCVFGITAVKTLRDHGRRVAVGPAAEWEEVPLGAQAAAMPRPVEPPDDVELAAGECDGHLEVVLALRDCVTSAGHRRGSHSIAWWYSLSS